MNPSLVSAGFDTLRTDPLGSMRMSPPGYGVLCEQLLQLAANTASGRLVLLLEGGYDVDGQAEAVSNCLSVLAGKQKPQIINDGSNLADGIISSVKKVHDGYWSF